LHVTVFENEVGFVYIACALGTVTQAVTRGAEITAEAMSCI